MSISPGENHCLLLRSEAKLSVYLILRSDAQHRVSKEGPETRAFRPTLDRPSRRPPRGLLRTREKSR
jgi:hypothetical protein